MRGGDDRARQAEQVVLTKKEHCLLLADELPDALVAQEVLVRV